MQYEINMYIISACILYQLVLGGWWWCCIEVECSSTVLPAGNYTMYAGLGCLSTTTVAATKNATHTSIVNMK